MSVVAEGLDALVFTGGVGEHSPMVRQRTVERLGFLGAAIDQDRNVDFQVEAGEAHRDGDVSSAESRVRVLVIAAREDLQIAREARTVLGG